MKRVKEIIMLIGLFVIVVILVLLYFASRYKANKIINNTMLLANIINKYDEMVYFYEDGVLYDENNNIIDTSIYMEANGKLVKDKYGHLIIYLKYGNKYICKSALGEIKYSRVCRGYNIEVNMTRNNYQISFDFNKDIDGYMISNKDNFNGNFIPLDLSMGEKFVLNLNNAGTYYIWFKDKYGNITEGIEYNAECLNVIKEEYSSNILYCTGSIINIDEKNFIVISDKGGEIDLISYKSLDNKMAHCNNVNNGSCFVDKDNKLEYNWGNSLINKYLNDDYYSSLSDEFKSVILEKEICNNNSGSSGCDNEDGCGGFKKDVIESNKWNCDNYVKSKIRLISYDEYVYLMDNSVNKISFKDYFHMINSSNESMKTLSVLRNGNVYTKEDSISKLSIRPVLTIKK